MNCLYNYFTMVWHFLNHLFKHFQHSWSQLLYNFLFTYLPWIQINLHRECSILPYYNTWRYVVRRVPDLLLDHGCFQCNLQCCFTNSLSVIFRSSSTRICHVSQICICDTKWLDGISEEAFCGRALVAVATSDNSIKLLKLKPLKY